MKDLNSLVPESVTCVFPRTTGGIYTKVVTLSSLAVVEFGNFVGTNETKHIRSSALAGGSGTPTNQAELDALATQLAEDFYKWKLGRACFTLQGVQPWEPTGLDDCITLQDEEVTSVCRRPIHAWDTEDVFHYGASGSQNDLESFTYLTSGTLVWNGITLDWDSVTVDIDGGSWNFAVDTTVDMYAHVSYHGYWCLTSTTLTPVGDMNDETLHVEPWWKIDTGGINLNGIVAAGDGCQILVTNTANTDITIAHEAGGSTAENRIATHTGADHTLAVDHSAWLIYDTTLSRWRLQLTIP